MINNFDQLINKVKEITQKNQNPARVIVAAGNDEAALSALIRAKELGLADGILVGDKNLIHEEFKKMGLSKVDQFEIIEEQNDIEICRKTVQAIHNKKAEIILKGKVKSATLLKVAFDPNIGLRTGRIISDTFVFEYPQRSGENKLLMITDGGFNLAPDLKEKIQILENAVQVAHALGNQNPKVAVLSATETVNPNMQSSVDAAIISKMNDRGQIKGCIVDGPLALDNAISEKAAKIKGIKSSVAGHADILLCPNIESANMMAKSTTYFANLQQAHATIGAKVPILIPSRNDTAESKLLTLALNIIISSKGKLI